MLLNFMTGLATFRVSTEKRNRATAQPRNRATAQPRNRAIVRGILSRKPASSRRRRIIRDHCPGLPAVAPVFTTTAPNFGGASVLASRIAPEQKPPAPIL
jgi:hypothetical protein